MAFRSACRVGLGRRVSLGDRRAGTCRERLVDAVPNVHEAHPELAGELLAGYGPSTREGYARDVRRRGDCLARFALGSLDASRVHVEAFVRERDTGVAPATLSRKLSANALGVCLSRPRRPPSTPCVYSALSSSVMSPTEALASPNSIEVRSL
jgi:hypothetical protein